MKDEQRKSFKDIHSKKIEDGKYVQWLKNNEEKFLEMIFGAHPELKPKCRECGQDIPLKNKGK